MTWVVNPGCGLWKTSALVYAYSIKYVGKSPMGTIVYGKARLHGVSKAKGCAREASGRMLDTIYISRTKSLSGRSPVQDPPHTTFAQDSIF
jgi:hypothetical protein